MSNMARVNIAILLMALLAGCSGSGDPSSALTDAPPSVQSPSPDSIALFSPGDALVGIAPRTSSAPLMCCVGSAFEAGLAQRVTAVDTSALYSPAWTDGSSTTDKLAYAIYSFNLQGYAGSPLLQFDWDEELLDYSNLWIGFSRWSSNSWEWYPGPADGILELGGDGFANYTKPGTGDMLVAVVLLGTELALLDRLQVGETAQGDWWMFGHDPQHTRRSPYVGAQTNNMKWCFTTTDSVLTSPAIGADGTMYLGAAWTLYAINLDGTEKWAYVTGNEVNSSPAIGTDGTVYVGSKDRKLYAINPDGSLKWAYTAGDYNISYSSPAIGPDGTVYVGSWNKKLHAVNPDGTEKWAYLTTGYVNSSPAIGTDGTVYVGSYDGKLYAINPDGNLKWAYTTASDVRSSPAIGADGTVYVGSWDTRIHAINADGTEKWSSSTGSGQVMSPTIGADGTVYVGCTDNRLYAFGPGP